MFQNPLRPCIHQAHARLDATRVQGHNAGELAMGAGGRRLRGDRRACDGCRPGRVGCVDAHHGALTHGSCHASKPVDHAAGRADPRPRRVPSRTPLRRASLAVDRRTQRGALPTSLWPDARDRARRSASRSGRPVPLARPPTRHGAELGRSSDLVRTLDRVVQCGTAAGSGAGPASPVVDRASPGAWSRWPRPDRSGRQHRRHGWPPSDARGDPNGHTRGVSR